MSHAYEIQCGPSCCGEDDPIKAMLTAIGAGCGHAMSWEGPPYAYVFPFHGVRSTNFLRKLRAESGADLAWFGRYCYVLVFRDEPAADLGVDRVQEIASPQSDVVRADGGIL